MFNFIKYLISLDVFGEPVTLNYRGESTFKTSIGAFFTIILRTFIFSYGLLMLIEVM